MIREAKSPRSPPLPETRALQEETQQDVEDHGETPARHIPDVWVVCWSNQVLLRLQNGPRRPMARAGSPPKRTSAAGEGAQSCPWQHLGQVRSCNRHLWLGRRVGSAFTEPVFEGENKEETPCGQPREAAGTCGRSQQEPGRCRSPAIEGIQTLLLVGCLQFVTAVHGLGALQGSSFLMHGLGAARRSPLAPEGEGKRGETRFGAAKLCPSTPDCPVRVSATQGQQENSCDFSSHAEEKGHFWAGTHKGAVAPSDNTLQSRAEPPQEAEEVGRGKAHSSVKLPGTVQIWAGVHSSAAAKHPLPRRNTSSFAGLPSLQPVAHYRWFYQRRLSAAAGKANTLPAPRRAGYHPAGHEGDASALSKPQLPSSFWHRQPKRSVVTGSRAGAGIQQAPAARQSRQTAARPGKRAGLSGQGVTAEHAHRPHCTKHTPLPP